MKGRYYEALTDDPMVDVITSQGSMREVVFDYEHAEHVIAMWLGVHRSPENVRSSKQVLLRNVMAALGLGTVMPPKTGKFPMHEGGRS